MIYLLEYYGDVLLGGVIWIKIDDVKDYYFVLLSKEYVYLKLNIEKIFWGIIELIVIDLFLNRIILYEEKL